VAAMPRLVHRYPKYRLHKATNRARVRHEGRTYRLPGPFDSPEMHRGYAELIDRLERGEPAATNGAVREKATPPSLLTIAELIERFWDYAVIHYRKQGGVQTGEAAVIRCALRPLLSPPYGELLAMEFRPSHLKAARDDMIRLGWTRRYINRSVGRIKR